MLLNSEYVTLNSPASIDQSAQAAIRAKPWNLNPSEVSASDPLTMLNEEEVKMLRWLSANHYRGAGEIIDAGAFLGGSTVAFCKGLRDADWRGRIVQSYDLFISDKYSAAYSGGGLSK